MDHLGFADQAHLTRSLKRFTGQTPGALVRSARRRRPDVLSDLFNTLTGRSRDSVPMETTTTTTIRPFTIRMAQAKLDDLRERLGKAVWPSTIEGQNHGGPALAQMKDLAGKLAAFDWRKQEAALNALPNFVTEIDGQNLHFIHVKSKEANATPLMLIHGWPGSIVEFLDQIGPLTDPVSHGGKATDAFDVVIPSLPGFGLSGPTREAGWNNVRISKALIALMDRLGYRKFAVQGGDVGAIIGPEMGRLAPEKFIGLHLNAATMGFIPMGPVSEADLATFSPAEKARLGDAAGVHAGEVRLQPAAVHTSPSWWPTPSRTRRSG